MEGSDLGSILSRVLESDLKKNEEEVLADRAAYLANRKQQALASGQDKLTASQLIDTLVSDDKVSPGNIEVPEEAPKQEADNARPKAAGHFPRPPGS